MVALIHDPRLTYEHIIVVDEFLMEDIEWWIYLIRNETYVEAKYVWLLKRPKDGDVSIYTDASGGIGVGGFMNQRAFQVHWDDTPYVELMKVRSGVDIQVLELLGSLIALELWWPQLVGKSVTIYNDNASAAAAIATKAPALWRSDLHYLIRKITQLSTQYKFYFWGIHIEGKKNDWADALSRFKNYNWEALGLTMDGRANALVNAHFQALMKYYPNRDPKRWKWTQEQMDILHIQRRKRKNGAIVEEWTEPRVQNKPKLPDSPYNILTQKSFD